MTIRLEAKRPDEVRDYAHDWSAFLGEDTITNSDVTVAGATLDSDEILPGDQSVKFWLSAGVDGSVATVSNTIETAGGRTETETFTLRIAEQDEPVSLSEVKAYLRVRHSDEDAKIEAMIARARLWVEDHTGLALVRREFVELRRTEAGSIRLFKGPLVSVGTVTYGDGLVYVPRFTVPSPKLIAASDSAWPSLDDGDAFEIPYVAGFADGEVDERLIGAMLALIEGEYAEGYAYPERATQAAERCCAYLRSPAI